MEMKTSTNAIIPSPYDHIPSGGSSFALVRWMDRLDPMKKGGVMKAVRQSIYPIETHSVCFGNGSSKHESFSRRIPSDGRTFRSTT